MSSSTSVAGAEGAGAGDVAEHRIPIKDDSIEAGPSETRSRAVSESLSFANKTTAAKSGGRGTDRRVSIRDAETVENPLALTEKRAMVDLDEFMETTTEPREASAGAKGEKEQGAPKRKKSILRQIVLKEGGEWEEEGVQQQAGSRMWDMIDAALDYMTATISVLDVASDFWVLYQWYQIGQWAFFATGSTIMTLAGLCYLFMFVNTFPGLLDLSDVFLNLPFTMYARMLGCIFRIPVEHSGVGEEEKSESLWSTAELEKPAESCRQALITSLSKRRKYKWVSTEEDVDSMIHAKFDPDDGCCEDISNRLLNGLGFAWLCIWHTAVSLPLALAVAPLTSALPFLLWVLNFGQQKEDLLCLLWIEQYLSRFNFFIPGDQVVLSKKAAKELAPDLAEISYDSTAGDIGTVKQCVAIDCAKDFPNTDFFDRNGLAVSRAWQMPLGGRIWQQWLKKDIRHHMLTEVSFNTSKGTFTECFLFSDLRPLEPSLQQIIAQKVARHAMFLAETLVESVPQSLLQLIYLTVAQEINVVNIISIVLSVLSVMSKAYTVSYKPGSSVKMFVLRMLIASIDVATLYFTLATVAKNVSDPYEFCTISFAPGLFVETDIATGIWLWVEALLFGSPFLAAGTAFALVVAGVLIYLPTEYVCTMLRMVCLGYFNDDYFYGTCLLDYYIYDDFWLFVASPVLLALAAPFAAAALALLSPFVGLLLSLVLLIAFVVTETAKLLLLTAPLFAMGAIYGEYEPYPDFMLPVLKFLEGSSRKEFINKLTYIHKRLLQHCYPQMTADEFDKYSKHRWHAAAEEPRSKKRHCLKCCNRTKRETNSEDAARAAARKRAAKEAKQRMKANTSDAYDAKGVMVERKEAKEVITEQNRFNGASYLWKNVIAVFEICMAFVMALVGTVLAIFFGSLLVVWVLSLPFKSIYTVFVYPYLTYAADGANFNGFQLSMLIGIFVLTCAMLYYCYKLIPSCLRYLAGYYFGQYLQRYEIYRMDWDAIEGKTRGLVDSAHRFTSEDELKKQLTANLAYSIVREYKRGFARTDIYEEFGGIVHEEPRFALCVVSFCGSANKFDFQLVRKDVLNGLYSMTCVFLGPVGGFCANRDCAGPTGAQKEEWKEKNKGDKWWTEEFEQAQKVAAAADRTDTTWRNKKTGQFDNGLTKCPYKKTDGSPCNYHRQEWKQVWLDNMEKWRASGQKGVFVYNANVELGPGQQAEKQWLDEKELDYVMLTVEQFKNLRVNKLELAPDRNCAGRSRELSSFRACCLH